jgi:hypothetical protein
MHEVELNTLDLKSFDNMQDFFTKFKYLIFDLRMNLVLTILHEKQLIITIFSNLGPKYLVYVSNFHSGRCLLGENYKIPTMAQSIESLTKEQKKSYIWAS